MTRTLLLDQLAAYDLLLSPTSAVLSLATTFDADAYTALLRAFEAAIGALDTEMALVAREMIAVLVGGNSDGPSIPALFWSNATAYDHAARNLSTAAPFAEINARTTHLRRVMASRGAFVGWLPLEGEWDAYVVYWAQRGMVGSHAFWYEAWNASVLAYTPEGSTPPAAQRAEPSSTSPSPPDSPSPSLRPRQPRVLSPLPTYPRSAPSLLRDYDEREIRPLPKRAR